jgi:hypothetical protein
VVEQDVAAGGAAVVAAVAAAVVPLAVVVVAVAAVAVDNVIAGWHEDAFQAVTEVDTALVDRQGSPEAEDASELDAKHLHCCCASQ